MNKAFTREVDREDEEDDDVAAPVLPQGANVDQYLAEAVARHDHKAFNDSKTLHTKVRVGQQKQKKAK